jgi:twitching motility two-component system response regulator PilG
MGIRTLRIAMLGLKATEQSALRSVCVLSAHSSRPFSHAISAGEPADIYVVDATDPDTVSRWSEAHDLTHHDVVLVDPPEGPRISSNVLRRPLLASRLLAMLDDVARRVVTREDGKGAARTASLPPAATSAPAGAAVLVVDDSPTVRKHLELTLRQRGIEARLVESGEQALAEVARRPFDLVLLDVELPGADGYQICKAIRRAALGRDLPVVMLTSRSSPFDRIRGSLAGCDAYLVKPVDPANFHRVLDAQLAARRAAVGGTAAAGWRTPGGQAA